jgi:outer membrane protein OmpA-like peptidoglycan-associated protein
MCELKCGKLSVLLTLFLIAGFSHATNPLINLKNQHVQPAKKNQVYTDRPEDCSRAMNPKYFLEQASMSKNGTTYFSSDSILISQPFVELIARQAEHLSTHSDVCIFIAGFSDPVGSTQYNQKLSLERVDEVAKIMVYLGVDPEQIIKVGYGEQPSDADNLNTSELAKQRRVEWVLIDSFGLEKASTILN